MKDMSVKTLLSNLVLIIFFCGTIGIALKFVTFFDHWVYFPSFPNTLDSLFLVVSATYFFVYTVYRKRQLRKND